MKSIALMCGVGLTMKPHIFKSIVYPGLWACVTAQKWPNRMRKLEPAPYAPVFYGVLPAQAYARWRAYYNKPEHKGISCGQ